MAILSVAIYFYHKPEKTSHDQLPRPDSSETRLLGGDHRLQYLAKVDEHHQWILHGLD